MAKLIRAVSASRGVMNLRRLRRLAIRILFPLEKGSFELSWLKSRAVLFSFFKKSALFLSCSALPLLLLFWGGCGKGAVTYPQDRVVQALRDIASKEYGIDNIKVEFAGTTMGVFLPLDQLFSLDFKDAIMSGKVTDMENLFKPTEAAVNKVEDLLFSMSRVMLSTDKKIEFYYLQATDVEKSGMELTFLGNIEDVKRVRFWDIPRSEYRKRVIHDIRLNQAVLWHRPVRHFFNDLNTEASDVIQKRYFLKTAAEKWSQEFIFVDARGQLTLRGQARWEILEMRSIPIQDDNIVVYAKVRAVPVGTNEPSSGTKTAEYLFQIASEGEVEKIRRIIPLAFLGSQPQGLGPSFGREMIYESLPNWETEFKVPQIRMGDFLSRQLTRRLQAMLTEDERVGNTFTSVKLSFDFEQEPEPRFTFGAVAPLRGVKEMPFSENQEPHEDILYLWQLAAREFVEVLRSYEYQGYNYLEFQIGHAGKTYFWDAKREDLELFRRHQRNFKSILTAHSPKTDLSGA